METNTNPTYEAAADYFDRVLESDFWSTADAADYTAGHPEAQPYLDSYVAGPPTS